MERMVTVPFDDLKALAAFVRGKQICTGTMDDTTDVTHVGDATKDFTALDIEDGYYVYDTTTGQYGAIVEGGVAATLLEVPAGAWAEGNTYMVCGPPIAQAKIVVVAQENDGQWHLCFYKDDGFVAAEEPPV